MASGPVISQAKKENIKTLLQESCRKSWIAKGYKKTNIRELCKDVGISVGTFYNLYPTKEDLFPATIGMVHNHLEEQAIDIVQSITQKDGFAKALKLFGREYDKLQVLYNTNCTGLPGVLNEIT